MESDLDIYLNEIQLGHFKKIKQMDIDFSLLLQSIEDKLEIYKKELNNYNMMNDKDLFNIYRLNKYIINLEFAINYIS